MSVSALSAINTSSYVSYTSRSKANGNSWSGYLEQERREALANRYGLGFDQLDASSSAARARVQSAEASAQTASSDAAQSADTAYHWQTFKNKRIPLSEAPDYSTWDKEDAYCDIIERYNLLNLLSPEKVKELGLSEEYAQMQIETCDLLYGWNPFEKQLELNGGKPMAAEDLKALDRDVLKEALPELLPSAEVRALDTDLPQRMNRKVYKEMYGITSDAEYEQRMKQEIASMYSAESFGAWGPDSGAVQVYNKLSQFDLTSHKGNLTQSANIWALAPRPSMIDGRNTTPADVFAYYDSVEQHLLQQYEAGYRPIEAYQSFKSWSELIREMYELCLNAANPIAKTSAASAAGGSSAVTATAAVGETEAISETDAKMREYLEVYKSIYAKYAAIYGDGFEFTPIEHVLSHPETEETAKKVAQMKREFHDELRAAIPGEYLGRGEPLTRDKMEQLKAEGKWDEDSFSIESLHNSYAPSGVERMFYEEKYGLAGLTAEEQIDKIMGQYGHGSHRDFSKGIAILHQVGAISSGEMMQATSRARFYAREQEAQKYINSMADQAAYYANLLWHFANADAAKYNWADAFNDMVKRTTDDGQFQRLIDKLF